METVAAPAAAPAAAPMSAPVETAAPQVDAVNPGEKPPAEIKVSPNPAKEKPIDVKWTDSFDPNLQEYVKTRGFTDPKMVLEQYQNLEKLRGVPLDKLLKLPDTPDAPEWNEIYQKLGKPVNPDGYGLEPVEGSDPSMVNWAKDAFHKLNLSTTQGRELMQAFNQFSESQSQAEQVAYSEAVQQQSQALKREWGNAYNQNIARAQAAYRTFGLPDKAVTALEKTMGFDGVMKFMHDLGAKLGEHSFVGSNLSQPGFGEGSILTPAAAKARITALKQDSEFKAKYLKGDVKAKAELTRLHEMAYAAD